MSRVRSNLRAGAALAALLIAAPAWAQEAPPAEELPSAPTATQRETPPDIVVTGSRIRRNPLSLDAPITFVDSEDMAKTGLNSVTDVLQRLPSAGGGLNSKFNSSGNSGNPPDGGGVGAGSAEIDLRYLGSKRTLVLVDGLRFVNGASASGVPGSVDLNSIPEGMIERVEVLQDGASAIYGSDAIAGVVNIITKKGQDGFDASAQIGSFLDEGDGFSQNYQISWGNGTDGPTQLVVGGSYVKQKPVSAADREISQFPFPYADACDVPAGGCSGYVPLGRFGIFGAIAPPDNPATPDDDENQPDLTLRDVVTGRPVYNPADPDDPASDFKNFTNADRFNFAPYNYIQIPLERLGLFANVHQELSPTVNLTGKLIWNRRKSRNQAAPLPLGIGQAAGNGNFLDTIGVHATNPYNPFGVTLDTSNLNFIFRRVVEVGPRQFFQTVNTLYGVVTLDGKFDLGGRDWFWDVNASYGQNKARQKMLGNINSQKLAQALGPVSGCTGECVPFNIFGGAGTITEAMLDFVTFTQRDSSKQTQWDVSANLAGSILSLPGGDLGIAIGAEYRDLKGRFDPDPVVAAGFTSDIPALPTKGGYHVSEAYAELNAPLLADQPFAELLELTGAVRHSKYSTSGSTTTFKGGVNWKPFPDLRLRASYSEGFRAPTIGELFGTPSRFDQTLFDPCSSSPGNLAPRRFQNDATVRANCIAQGVPASGSYQQPNPQLSVTTGGNEDLDAETSKGWNLGAVFSPAALPRFSVEANYYRMKINGAIQSIDAKVTLDRCTLLNDSASCANISRAPSGPVILIDGILQNIAAIKTEGVDLNLAYRTSATPIGTFAFTWNNNFLFNYDVFVPSTDGISRISQEGTEKGAPDQAFPTWKSIGIVDWDGADFGATLTGRYIKDVAESQNDNVLNDGFYTDVQLRWKPRFFEDLRFAVGVNNLFDKDPPACISCNLNNFDPTTYDVPGRYYYARASIKM